MSSIAFHTIEQTGYISGAERAHLDQVVRETARACRRSAFGMDTSVRPSPLRSAMSWPARVLADGRVTFEDQADLYVRDSAVRAVLPTGPTAEGGLNIDLNSVIVAGSPAVRLAARISGQCEVHMFVEGEDRAWFADAIEQAVDLGVFRQSWSCYPQREDEPNGWRGIAEMARTSDSSPIVLSYSVCDWFPDRETAAWPEALPDEDTDWEASEAAEQVWADLPPAEQWERAMAGLRRKAEVAWLLRLAPDNLGEAKFGTDEALTWWGLAQAWEAGVVA